MIVRVFPSNTYPEQKLVQNSEAVIHIEDAYMTFQEAFDKGIIKQVERYDFAKVKDHFKHVGDHDMKEDRFYGKIEYDGIQYYAHSYNDKVNEVVNFYCTRVIK